MDEGSYGGGFALGFFLGVIGLIIAINIKVDNPEIRRGAKQGVFAFLVTAVVLVACISAAIFGFPVLFK